MLSTRMGLFYENTGSPSLLLHSYTCCTCPLVPFEYGHITARLGHGETMTFVQPAVFRCVAASVSLRLRVQVRSEIPTRVRGARGLRGPMGRVRKLDQRPLGATAGG